MLPQVAVSPGQGFPIIVQMQAWHTRSGCVQGRIQDRHDEARVCSQNWTSAKHLADMI